MGGTIEGDSRGGREKRKDSRRGGVDREGLCLLMKSVEAEAGASRGQLPSPLLTLQAIGGTPALLSTASLPCTVWRVRLI